MCIVFLAQLNSPFHCIYHSISLLSMHSNIDVKWEQLSSKGSNSSEKSFRIPCLQRGTFEETICSCTGVNTLFPLAIYYKGHIYSVSVPWNLNDLVNTWTKLNFKPLNVRTKYQCAVSYSANLETVWVLPLYFCQCR